MGGKGCRAGVAGDGADQVVREGDAETPAVGMGVNGGERQLHLLDVVAEQLEAAQERGNLLHQLVERQVARVPLVAERDVVGLVGEAEPQSDPLPAPGGPVPEPEDADLLAALQPLDELTEPVAAADDPDPVGRRDRLEGQRRLERDLDRVREGEAGEQYAELERV